MMMLSAIPPRITASGAALFLIISTWTVFSSLFLIHHHDTQSIKDEEHSILSPLHKTLQHDHAIENVARATQQSNDSDDDTSHNTTLTGDITIDHPHRSMFTIPLKEWNREPSEETSITSKLLKVYVYDNLPANYTSDVEECMLEEVRNETKFTPVSTKMADIALIYLFQTYPGRVYDPNQADIFVVPYAHTSHCLCNSINGLGWSKACGQVPQEQIDYLTNQLLTHYNESTKDRHLFVLSGNQYFMNDSLENMPLTIIGGNLSPQNLFHEQRGRIVIPYLNDKADFQKIFTQPPEWYIRERKYAFGYVFGKENSKSSGSPRKVRGLFQTDVQERNISTVGGMPFYMKSFQDGFDPAKAVWKAYDVYENSILCPVLAGDSAQQARFFDVMMKGCIPVMLSYNRTVMHTKGVVKKWNKNSYATKDVSWYRPLGETKMQVYPFVKGLIRHPFPYDDVEIDYDECVVEVPLKGLKEISKLVDVMDDMILNHMDIIRQKQQNLIKCAPKVAFGMGPNAHKYVDVFAQVIKMIRYHLDAIEEKERNIQI